MYVYVLWLFAYLPFQEEIAVSKTLNHLHTTEWAMKLFTFYSLTHLLTTTYYIERHTHTQTHTPYCAVRTQNTQRSNFNCYVQVEKYM